MLRCRLSRIWGVVLGAGLVAVAILATPEVAGATIDHNTIGCAGQAVITPNKGAPFTANATQSEVHLPRKGGPLQYTGSVTTITHNHHGYVALRVGLWHIHVYEWSGANRSNKSSDTGTRAYPKALNNLPPGKYYLTGGHFAPEGSCTGHMTVVIGGSVLGTPAGLAAAIGTVIFAVLTLGAGIPRAGKRGA